MAGLFGNCPMGAEIDTSDIPERTEEMGNSTRRLKQGCEPAAGCRWDRVAEEGWRRNAGKPDAAGADAGGVCGRGEECGSSIVRMPTHLTSQRRDEWGHPDVGHSAAAVTKRSSCRSQRRVASNMASFPKRVTSDGEFSLSSTPLSASRFRPASPSLHLSR